MYNKYFEICFEEVVLMEGKYVDNPYDSGGKTKYGITEALAKHYGYDDDMKDLSLDFAKNIYKKEFWDVLSLDHVALLSLATARELFESSVNIGYKKIAINFQQCLNILNLRSTIYRDIKVDGMVGPNTVSAFRSHLEHRQNDRVICKMLNCLQGTHYIGLAVRREKDETFIYGWFENRVEL